jgi:hypothetical protein
MVEFRNSMVVLRNNKVKFRNSIVGSETAKWCSETA